MQMIFWFTSLIPLPFSKTFLFKCEDLLANWLNSIHTF